MDAIVNSLISQVLEYPPHYDIYFTKDQLPHPVELGFRIEYHAEPKGQYADFRLQLSDGSCIHSSEYDEYYGFHWDKVDPNVNPIEHLRRDSPLYYIILCTIGGAAIGAGWSYITNNKKDLNKNAIKGGLLGLEFGVKTAEWE
jgi:hypothetical protein